MKLWVADAVIQALTTERGDLDFGHVQPACVLRCVVEDDPAQKSTRRIGAEHFDEASPEMGAQVVDDQMDASRRAIGTASIRRWANANEFGLAAMRGDLGDPPPPTRFDRHEDVASSRPDVLVVPNRAGMPGAMGNPGRLARSSCLLFSSIQITGSSARQGRAYRSSNSYIRPPVLLGEHGDAPHHLAPGLEAVFFARGAMKMQRCH